MSLLIGSLTALSFTACNDNDSSYHSLTKEEKAQCFQTVKGDYKGHLVYATGETKNGKTVTDTLDVTWSIATDSTLVINNFPSKVLAVYVTNSNLKKALEEAPTQKLTCRTGYIQTSPVGFLLNPVTPAFNLTYDGATHKVQVPFYTNTTQSYGVWNATKKIMQLQIVEGGLYIDSKQSSDLKTGSSFYIYGEKSTSL